MTLTTAALKSAVALVQWRPSTLGEAFEQLGHVAAAWEHASPSQRARLRGAASDEAGLVQRRKARGTGVTVAVFIAAEQGIDAGDDKYAVVCETHGAILGRATVALARSFAAVPTEWCGGCQEASVSAKENAR